MLATPERPLTNRVIGPRGMAFPRLPEPNGIVTFSEARERGLKHYFSGRPCVHGHVSYRATVNGTCLRCTTLKSIEWQKRNRDKVRASQKRHKDKDPEEYRRKGREWFEKSKPEQLRRIAAWTEKNIVSVRATKAAWKKRNPDNSASHTTKRRAKLLNATPFWVDHNAIADVYAECAKITRETGILHHVDHIIPLIHPKVCGLHVHWNLRVVTAQENWSKNNKFTPGLAA